MISREDAIDNFKMALNGDCSPYIEDYREEIEWAIGDMYDMTKIRKYMSIHPKFEKQIEEIIK